MAWVATAAMNCPFGKLQRKHELRPRDFPDREILLAQWRILLDNFPTGKFKKP
jgi:hypothetical protein